MKYNIGDKVVIIDERTFGMDDSGKMDKYLEKTEQLHSKEDEDLFQEIDKTLKSLRENLDDLKSDFQETQENIDNEQPKEVGKTPLEFGDEVKIDIENSTYIGFQSDIGRIIEQHISKEEYWVATSMVYGGDILLFHLEELKYIG